MSHHLQLSLQMIDTLICLNSVLPGLLEVCELLLCICQLVSPLAGGCLLLSQRLLSLTQPAQTARRGCSGSALDGMTHWCKRTVWCHAAAMHAPEAARTAVERSVMQR